MSEGCYVLKSMWKTCEYLLLGVRVVSNVKKACCSCRLSFQVFFCDVSVSVSPQHALEFFDKVNIST